MGGGLGASRRQDGSDLVVSYGMDWPLLAPMDDRERRELLAITRRRTYDRGETVFHATDLSDSMHLVRSGRLSVHVSLPTGATAMTHVFGPGDFFGEASLLKPGEPRIATVTALEPAETWVVAEPAYRQLAERRPAVHRFITSLMATRIETLSARLFESLYLGLEHRLRARLRDLVEVYGDGPGPVTIPLNQSQLADLTGGTRPTVNQALQKLADAGLVRLARGRLEVLDRDAL
jgi:CRP/FNR family transcriptional regulator, cyclic AMP receptor protein